MAKLQGKRPATTASIDAGEAPAEKRGRQNLPAPICPYCTALTGAPVVCESNRSDPFFTRYYCPTADCTFSQKVARPQIEKAIADHDREDFSAR